MQSVDRAAVLLLALGEDDAARVLKHLDPREVQRVGSAMASLRSVNMGQISVVLDAFLDTVTGQSGITIGASEYIRKMLVGALGEDKARTLVDRILGGNTAGIDKLKWMDARTVADFMMHEHPQIQAIVLSHLEPDQAAEVLGYMTDAEAKVDVLLRVATLESVPPNALLELNAVLEEQVGGKSATRFAEMGGTRVAAEIMNKLESRAEEAILAGIRQVERDARERNPGSDVHLRQPDGRRRQGHSGAVARGVDRQSGAGAERCRGTAEGEDLREHVEARGGSAERRSRIEGTRCASAKWKQRSAKFW